MEVTQGEKFRIFTSKPVYGTYNPTDDGPWISKETKP